MSTYPKRIALIMDGNRRWGKNNKTSLEKTYSIGARNLKNIIKKSQELKIEQLTAFAFSTENWNRKTYEISLIFYLLEKFIRSEIADMNSNNIKFKLIGDRSPFKKSLIDIINRAENITKDNSGLLFNLAFNYGGEMDILESFKSLGKMLLSGKKNLSEITLENLKENLFSSKVKDIDFLIRTGGEQRISNFMLLQIIYAELYFSKLNWPEFNIVEFQKSLEVFSCRERRFGNSVNNKNKYKKITSI